MSDYTIHCVGFKPVQLTPIAEILDMASSTLSHSWKISENTKSDVLMLNMLGENSQKLFLEFSNFSGERIELTSKNSLGYWVLGSSEQKSLSNHSKELVDLLNQFSICSDDIELSAVLEKKEEPTQSIKRNKPSTTLNIKDKNLNKPTKIVSVNDHFFSLLLQIREEKKYKIINLNALPALYLALEENSYYFSGSKEELLEYCWATPSSINTKTLSRAKFNKALKSETNELESRKFQSLVSYAIIKVSQGQLLNGHSIKQSFILNKMPNIDENSILSRYKDIAEFMYRHKGSLFDLTEKLKCSTSDAYDFYNVCYLLGNIKIISTEPNNSNNSTLGKFIKSFFVK